ncbi:MAG: 16S rRNA (adenine(1518)-N(6)/adenine(1519)-N(6))-dimethyltransferase RsmA [Ignavibacteria bacterium]|nr:16S rRNA (adenine(1518)-N(6)/adenine(1519)-N(6))-dimethyltransferase RsmA [Ignavibacteria bacterium]
MKIPAKKSLGQNYLIDRNISRKIVDSFSISENDRVLEIGPGRGAITRYIHEKTSDVIAIEIDKDNFTYLKNELPSLKLLHKDILKTDFKSLSAGKKLRVIGNVPYNISTPIVFKLISERRYIIDAQLMVQEEVAQRLTASAGSKLYGIPSVILQAFSKVKPLFKVPPSCFRPEPKVYSRVIYIDFSYSLEDKITDTEFFIRVVKAAFATRRKTLKNSLRKFGSIESEYIDLKKRAETLSVNDFIELSNKLKQMTELS